MDQDTGRVFERNIKQLKRYVDRKETETSVDAEEVEASKMNTDRDELTVVDASVSTNQDNEEPRTKRRSARKIEPPKRFDVFSKNMKDHK